MHRLWANEDGDSGIDFTRRRFLVSLMEDMTLSSPWRFGEEIEEGEDDRLRRLPPPSQFLIPCNLRLFRPEEIESKLKKQINKRIKLVEFPADDEEGTGETQIVLVDFSQGFLPIGFF